jgi:hypothetical protein
VLGMAMASRAAAAAAVRRGRHIRRLRVAGRWSRTRRPSRVAEAATTRRGRQIRRPRAAGRWPCRRSPMPAAAQTGRQPTWGRREAIAGDDGGHRAAGSPVPAPADLHAAGERWAWRMKGGEGRRRRRAAECRHRGGARHRRRRGGSALCQGVARHYIGFARALFLSLAIAKIFKIFRDIES